MFWTWTKSRRTTRNTSKRGAGLSTAPVVMCPAVDGLEQWRVAVRAKSACASHAKPQVYSCNRNMLHTTQARRMHVVAAARGVSNLQTGTARIVVRQRFSSVAYISAVVTTA